MPSPTSPRRASSKEAPAPPPPPRTKATGGAASPSRRSPSKPAAGLASTLVLFVRHGTTPTTGKVLPGRAPGLRLAETGTKQAEALAERLANWQAEVRAPAAGAAKAKPRSSTASSTQSGIAAVYASPLERTRETAAPIAAKLGLRTKLDKGLLECDFGEWTGRELKDLSKLPEWNTVQRYPSGFRFPGGESFAGMQARIVDTVAKLCEAHRGQAIVVVSHADPIKAAVADAMGTHLDLFQRIVVSPCSLTAVSYGPVGPSVLSVNSTGSLSELRLS